MSEPLTDTAVRNMVRAMLTGDDERDARHLARVFRMVGFTLPQWRQVIAECKAEANATAA